MNGEQVLQIILAILGVYFLYTVFITKENKLFGGENQTEDVSETQVTEKKNVLNNDLVNNVLNNNVETTEEESEEAVAENSEIQGLEEEELYNVDLSNNIGENSNNGCASKKLLPEDLLPKDQDNIWASGDSGKINYLESGHHIGINTVGQSLKNANRQIRSEPANPRDAVSPWNQSTIEPDSMRKQLELGEGETRNSE